MILGTFTIRLPSKIIVSTDVQIAYKGLTNHSKLDNLDYESSGHTGFASSLELLSYARKDELATEIKEEDIEIIIGGN
jgi:hypothetical protein